MITADLPQLAQSAGLRRSRDGAWKQPGTKHRWKISRTRTALRMETPWQLTATAHPLAVHADLAGPIKLVGDLNTGVAARVEFFIGPPPGRNDIQRLIEPEAADGQQQQLGRLVAVGSTLGECEQVDGWDPPSPQRLAAWLRELGYEPATDQDQNLRLTLKRPGRDGQVRIEGRAGRLRLAMPLGNWPSLDAAPRTAMLGLAGEFNTRTALVRIAWYGEAAGPQRAEAQVDLSGIPATPDDDPGLHALWLQLLRGATAGLHLALAQLALELDVLADEQHRELVEALL